MLDLVTRVLGQNHFLSHFLALLRASFRVLSWLMPRESPLEDEGEGRGDAARRL